MAEKSQHVMRGSDGGWIVRKGGSDKATKRFETQEDAIKWGQDVAKRQHAEFYIHGVDGKIREKKSYGEDRTPHRGEKR
ncbi:DUF2188 domain-containing protein [Rheinheimera sp.]|uniref:DUF2188 domain-containing protein n=1 Tax=Rheinheimera sp. TaxID=1869214 RepID=UPI0027BA011A|nr:DUF2188 domain-containing protein [Rheinheimera sp.]